MLAVCCAVVTNLAFFFKQRGARIAPSVDLRHPLRCGRSLFAVRWFALGMALAVVAWVLHVAAMALAPLSDVQVVLAGGIVLVGVMAERLFGLPVSRRQWLGLALTAAGLAAFAATARTAGAHASFSPAAMIGFEAALCLLGALLIAGRRAGAPAEHRGAMVGAASGILFGVSDLSIKALTGIAGAHGPLAPLFSPWLALALGAAVVAFFSSARSFQEGEPVAVIAITTAAANVSSVAGGILIFGDPMAGGTFALLTQSLGIAAILLATLLMPAFGGRERAVATA